MSVPVVAFLGLLGGQGKTTLVHHLSWMFSDLGAPVLAVDLDPQGDLTRRFLGVDGAAGLREEDTIYGSLAGLLRGDDALGPPHLITPGGHVALLAGDVGLWELAASLEEAWWCPSTGHVPAAHALGSIRRLLSDAAELHGARMVLIDLAPGFGALNRAALAAADHLLLPVVPDAFAVRALRVLGEELDRWRERRRSLPAAPHDVDSPPPSSPKPLGYVVQSLYLHVSRPIGSAQRALRELPVEYGRRIAKVAGGEPRPPEDDEPCLGVLSPLHVLAPIAADAGKPMFHLTPADGAVGSVMKAALRSRAEFESLARVLAARLDVPLD